MKLITLQKRVFCVGQSLSTQYRQWFIITMLITQIVHHSYAQHTYFEENTRTLLACHISRAVSVLVIHLHTQFVAVIVMSFWIFALSSHSIACKLHTSQSAAFHSSIINAAHNVGWWQRTRVRAFTLENGRGWQGRGQGTHHRIPLRGTCTHIHRSLSH